MIKLIGSIIFVIIFLSGCQTTSSKKSSSVESYNDIKGSIKAVAEGIAGKEITNEELKNFEKDLKSDPETQSAVKAITNSITKEKVIIKYCPKCGKRFSPDIEYCPDDNTKLQILE